jgi:hypothetical protein
MAVMVKLRKGPVCRGTLSDGSACQARIDRVGERCQRCRERCATGADVEARRELACEPDLPSPVFELLGTDPDDDVRLSISRRDDCPLVILQRLEHDDHPDVRAAACTGLSSALTPRMLRDGARGDLFTPAELEALGQADGAATDEVFGPPPLDPSSAAVLAGLGDILDRLEALGGRLSSLESVLAATGDRLEVISDRLDDFADAPLARRPVHSVRRGPFR